MRLLNDTRGVRIIRALHADETEKRGGVVSFSLDGVHPHDVSQIFDSEGIAIQGRPPLRDAAGYPEDRSLPSLG